MSERAISSKFAGLEVGDLAPVRIMGVINLTKNSFYSGSVRTTANEILSAAVKMQEDGAAILDLGARSTAPYRTSEVSVETEKRLLREAIKLLSRKVDVPISADTTRYEPAREALRAGAQILNDVYGFTQRDSRKLADLVSSGDHYLLIAAHERKQARPCDAGPVERVKSSLGRSLKFAEAHGISKKKICVDPGIGFFNDERFPSVEWNSTVLAKLELLRDFKLPICVGLSRKSFIGRILEGKPTEDRLIGSLSATAISVYNGAHIIRTHDVKETRDVARIAEALREKRFNA